MVVMCKVVGGTAIAIVTVVRTNTKFKCEWINYVDADDNCGCCCWVNK